ncbi:MFS transporter [Rathayibacter sp. VKM Ac-2835]|uniref:MFS transporter n=1 Tax=Rathayibacter sp. VKM Ac-2835 TaxID=2739043 RepID=UPI00349F56F9
MTRGPTPVGRTVAVLAFAGLSASFMQTLVVPLQARLPALLGASSDDTPWVITVTLVAATVVTPIAGRLGDMFGKRRVAVALLIVQAVGAVLAGLAEDLPLMLVARALQGVAAGVVPLGISILRDVVAPGRMGSATALVSATLGVGGALGLPLSAYAAEALDWHAIFWFAAVLSVAAIALYLRVVPASALRTPARIDVVGMAGLAVGLVGVLIAVSRGGTWGWADQRTLGFLIGGLVVLVLWTLWELRVRDPLIDLRAALNGAVLITNIASVAVGFGLFASSITFPQLLVLPEATGIGLGLPLVVAALILAPSGLMMLAVSPVAGWIQRRHGPRPLLVVGSLVVAVGYALALVLRSEAWQILVVNILLGIGVGLAYAAMPALIMRAVPVSQTGAANGLNALARSLGTTAAAAVIGALLAQSTVTVGGATGPSGAGFTAALALGLGAALIGAIVAAAIPRPSAAEPATPDRP